VVLAGEQARLADAAQAVRTKRNTLSKTHVNSPPSDLAGAGRSLRAELAEIEVGVDRVYTRVCVRLLKSRSVQRQLQDVDAEIDALAALVPNDTHPDTVQAPV
jgi:hypothetical protein